jgi:hypothetical protein
MTSQIFKKATLNIAVLLFALHSVNSGSGNTNGF